MGIISGAMASMLGGGLTAAGDAMQKYNNNQQLAELETNKAIAIATAQAAIKNQTDNQQRAQLAARIALPQATIDQATIANMQNDPNNSFVSGNTQLNPDGTAPDNAAPASSAEMAAYLAQNPSEQANYAPSPKQQIGLQIQQAIKTGDIDTANTLQKLEDAGKVSVGYGGTVVDQNQIDPATGKPTIIIDNSADRTGVGLAMAGARQTSADANMERADTYQQRADQGKPLTPQQIVINNEINAARSKVAGMSDADIKLQTNKFTASGRANPAYDPMLASRLKLAGKSKFGYDEAFDPSAQGNSSAAPANNSNSVLNRFSTDPSMAGMKTGQMTPNGLEVLDKNGLLIGHYQ